MKDELAQETPLCCSERVMTAIKVARRAFQNRLFVEPLAWAPPYKPGKIEHKPPVSLPTS